MMIINAIRQPQAMHRTVIEQTYTSTCMVTEQQKVKKPNGSTGFEEVKVLEGQPCLMIYKTVSSASDPEPAAAINQGTVLLISPEVEIKPGSRITVNQNGVTADYARSGIPAVFATHQEINLESFKGYT